MRIKAVWRRRSYLALAQIAVAISLAASAAQGAPEPLITPADNAAAKTMFDALLSPEKPPFSFNYDGKPAADQLAAWKPVVKEEKLDDHRTQRTVTWKDASTGLTVRMVSIRYSDMPAAEWTVYLRNDGTTDTKLIENLRGIDATVGQANGAATSEKKRTGWSAGKNFPSKATGEPIEFVRGWVGAWRPMTQADVNGRPRFATDGKAPWIARDADSDGVLLMPAEGIEGATDATGSGKSPGVGFVAPVSGFYRVAGDITDIGPGGNGVEWILGSSDGGGIYNGVHASGEIDDGQSKKFDRQMYLRAGERLGVAIHSRGSAEGDLCRLNFNVTQVTDVIPGDVVVHTNKGSDVRANDYDPLTIGLAPGDSVPLESIDGRPTNASALPYFNFQFGSSGALLAVGWPGQWDATLSRQNADVHVSAGQQKLRAVLRPGEEIRTPLIALLPYTGDDVQRGQNIWRRWMVAYNIPRRDGKTMSPILNGNSSHQFNEMLNANEANQKLYIDRYLEEGIKIDHWWMDAGWYPQSGSWVNTGTWKPDPKRFPNGLRAITDHAHSKGVKSVVWFEPERVTPDSEIYDEHPGFLLAGGLELNSPMGGTWLRRGEGTEPNLIVNPTDRTRRVSDTTWAPHQLALHPGPNGEFAALRYTASIDGTYKINAKFSAGAASATTDVHVLHAGKAIFDSFIGVNGKPASALYGGTVQAKKGDTIDFVVGRGNGRYESDTTALDLTITGPDGKAHVPVAELIASENPHNGWTSGALPAGEKPDANGFVAFNRQSNPAEPYPGWKLFNLGDPVALKWITDRVDSLIKSQGIDIYRQDFNMSPLTFWRGNDAPDRQGVTENLYVQGYLKYWDALRERNPKIWIDSCASGGQRNDLETMRRAVPFIRSDYLFEPIGQQAQAYGISQWIPYSGCAVLIGKSAIMGPQDDKVNVYNFRSTMASVFTMAVKVDDRTIDYAKIRTLLGEWRDFSPAYLGDYYPLTEHSLDSNKWMAWQYDVANEGHGFVQAFRRPEVTEDTFKFKFHGLDKAAKYEVADVDHADRTRTLTGAQLVDDGYEIKLNEKPGSAILRYRVAK